MILAFGTAALLALAALTMLARESAQTVLLDVDFKLVANDDASHQAPRPEDRLSGVPVRLVFSRDSDWQSPNAGIRFTTDAQGHAHFSTSGTVDLSWHAVNAGGGGFGGLSVFKHSPHMWIAAELEQLVPCANGGYDTHQWLHTMEVHCVTESDCASSGIDEIYARDQNGHFTLAGIRSQSGLRMPGLPQQVLSGPGYKTSGLFLSTYDPEQRRWKLNITLQRKPATALG
jgi:hypothetical protein